MKNNRLAVVLASVLMTVLLMACSTAPLVVEQGLEKQPEINLPIPAANPDIGSVVFGDSELQDSLITTATSGNLLVNGGFEGDLKGWTACGNAANLILSTDKHEGTTAGQLSNDCFYQSVPVTAGDEVALSCYTKESGSTWTGMGLGFSDSTWTNVGDAPTVVISGDQYMMYNTVATVPSDAVNASMWVSTDGVALIDECIITVNSTPEPVSNLLLNPSFEQGTNAWNNCGAADGYEIVSTPVTDGTSALSVNKGCVYNTKQVEADKTYKLTCDAQGGTDHWASMTFSYLDASWATIINEVVPVNSATMQTYSSTIAAPSNTVYAAVTFYTEGETVFDNCVLMPEGDAPPPPPPPPPPPVNNTCIGDTVFSDSNNNGLQDASEVGIAGVTIDLFAEQGTADGVVNGTDTLVETQTTDTNGNYKFCGLDPFPQFYVIALTDTANVLDGFSASNAPLLSIALNTDQFLDTVDFAYHKPGDVVKVPAIDIRKNAEGADSFNIDYGATATYTVNVKNTGNVDLTMVEVSDPDKTDCARQYATLAVGEEKTYTCEQVNVTAGFTNTATATAMYLDQMVQDMDISEVIVGPQPQPSIDIRKQAEGPDSRTFDFGANVSYSIVVTNTGNVDLTNVVVTDPTKSDCARNIGALTAGNNVTYSCILPNVTTDLTNSAVVKGSYAGQEVSDSDSSSIIVLPEPAPAIDIRKQAEGPDSREVEFGENVIYNVVVTNTGNVALTNVIVNDSSKTDCYNVIGDLAVGQVVDYTCTLRGASQDLTNSVIVTGDYVAQTVTDSDESSITIIARNGSIGNSIWWDDNKNGLIDGDEVGIKGVTVHLIKTNNNGAYIKTTTTNQSGTYYFNDVAPGDYKIKVILPDGTRATVKDAGNDSKDSDINSDGKTGVITVGNGQNVDHVDAGLVYTMYEEHDNNLLKNFHGRYDYKVIGASENYREDRYDCRDRGDQTVHLSIPSGAHIAAAYLYWSGSGNNDSRVYLNGSTVDSQQSYNYYLPNGSWSGNYYGNVSDVSSKVNGSGSYKVSGLTWSNASNYCKPNSAYGVWSMVVVYEKDSLPVSSVNVYKSFEKSWPASNWSFDIDKLADNHCARTAEVTHISYEGDHYKGEDLWINGEYKGNNTYNGSAGPNLDIDTHTVQVAANQSSIKFKTSSYATNTIFGNAIEFAINGGFVAKTNSCSTLKPN